MVSGTETPRKPSRSKMGDRSALASSAETSRRPFPSAKSREPGRYRSWLPPACDLAAAASEATSLPRRLLLSCSPLERSQLFPPAVPSLWQPHSGCQDSGHLLRAGPPFRVVQAGDIGRESWRLQRQSKSIRTIWIRTICYSCLRVWPPAEEQGRYTLLTPEKGMDGPTRLCVTGSVGRAVRSFGVRTLAQIRGDQEAEG